MDRRRLDPLPSDAGATGRERDEPWDAGRRAAEDQAAADEARARFRRDGPPSLSVSGRLAPLLGPGERVVAMRTTATLDRREPVPGVPRPAGLAGELYVTSARLLLVGRVTVSLDLEAIREAVVSGERLLLILDEGRGVTVQAERPRLLWAEIVAARAAGRAWLGRPGRGGAGGRGQPAAR